jgi:hypothetical protein
MAEHDINGDGGISFKEFSKMMMADEAIVKEFKGGDNS